MNHTIYGNLTDEELVAAVCTKEDVTDLELELMFRLEALQDRIEDLENGVHELETELGGQYDKVHALEVEGVDG